MRFGSRLVQTTLFVVAYLFVVQAAPLVFAPGPENLTGRRYMLLLTAVLLLLAAHGYQLVRRSQIRRFSGQGGGIQDVTTDLTMSLTEILLGWLGVSAALVFLFYAAPLDDLRQWYPRLFLCLTVFFGITVRRSLIFVYSAFPFVLTATMLTLFDGAATQPISESAAQAAFLAGDVALLIWAVRLTRNHGVFSVSQFEMAAGPGTVGGRLSGVIRNQQKAMPEAGYQLDLSCIRQTRRAGERAQGEVLWHDRKHVRGDLPGARHSGSSIPVSFLIPAMAPASAGEDGYRISWMLRAAAQLPESTFSCAFEVPVESANPEQEDRPPEDAAIEASPGAQAPELPSIGQYAAPGRARFLFRFPSTWNSASEILTAAYFLFWAQLMWPVTAQGIDWSGWAMFGGGLAFLVFLLAPWAWSVEMKVEGGMIAIREGFLGFAKQKLLPIADARSVLPVTAGLRPGLIEAAEHYNVEICTRSGHTFRVARHIRSFRTAESIADEMKRAIDGYLAR